MILKILNFQLNLETFTKSKKRNYIAISVFGNKNKKKHQSMYQNTTLKKHVDLLLTGEGGKRHYALIKDFNTFMNDQTLHLRRKHFRCYCLQAFTTETSC